MQNIMRSCLARLRRSAGAGQKQYQYLYTYKYVVQILQLIRAQFETKKVSNLKAKNISLCTNKYPLRKE